MSQFTYVKKGYNPEEVDKYIANLEAIIKSYREKDNAIKNAIISAQVAADNMVKNARLQADEYKIQIARELEKLKGQINRERATVQNFQDSYASLVRTYLAKLDEDETSGVHARLDDMEKLINHLLATDIIPSLDSQTPGQFAAIEQKPPAPPAPRPIPREELMREPIKEPAREQAPQPMPEPPTPEPELEPEPEPIVPQPEPEPFVPEPQPKPEPFVSEPEPAPFVPEPEPDVSNLFEEEEAEIQEEPKRNSFFDAAAKALAEKDA